jgi:hypothetical protein
MSPDEGDGVTLPERPVGVQPWLPHLAHSSRASATLPISKSWSRTVGACADGSGWSIWYPVVTRCAVTDCSRVPFWALTRRLMRFRPQLSAAPRRSTESGTGAGTRAEVAKSGSVSWSTGRCRPSSVEHLEHLLRSDASEVRGLRTRTPRGPVAVQARVSRAGAPRGVPEPAMSALLRRPRRRAGR